MLHGHAARACCTAMLHDSARIWRPPPAHAASQQRKSMASAVGPMARAGVGPGGWGRAYVCVCVRVRACACRTRARTCRQPSARFVTPSSALACRHRRPSPRHPPRQAAPGGAKLLRHPPRHRHPSRPRHHHRKRIESQMLPYTALACYQRWPFSALACRRRRPWPHDYAFRAAAGGPRATAQRLASVPWWR